MTPERYNRITQVLDKRQPDLTVITDEVHKSRNLAAIVRNCDAVGIDNMHCVVPKTGYQIFMGTSASAEKWVEMRHHADVITPIKDLKQQGYQIISAHLSNQAVDYRAIDYTLPTALLMGAEVEGVSDAAVAESDHQVVLPMLGMVESYNVSVACALILSEAQNQREKAGLYNTRRLSETVYKQRFFRWGHPKLAEFCDENNLPYPECREDGEVLNQSQWYVAAREEIKKREK